MDFSSKSLRNKTILFSLALTTSILFAGFSLICFRELTFLSKQLSDKIGMESRISSSLIRQNYGLGNIIELRRTLQTLAESIKLEQAEFTNDQGQSLWQYQPAAAISEKSADMPGFLSKMLIKVMKRSEPRFDIRGNLVNCRTKIEFVNGSVLGYFSWRFSAQPLFSGALARLTIIFITFLVLILFFAILVYYFSSRILKPLPDFINKVSMEFKSLNIPHKELKVADMDFLNNAFDDLMAGWKKAQADSLEASKLAAIGGLAAQVAHDIRSPLTALDAALKNTAQIPEEQRIIVRHAVNRIRDIANNLIERNRELKTTVKGVDISSTVVQPPEIHLLSSLIDPVVTEKRLQFESKPGIDIDFELAVASYGLFAKIQAVEFKRLVSNLVNNAVEVLGEKGAVNLVLEHENGNIVLKVSDNGRGIPSEILAKLGRKGETHGKAGGSGLGLFHARTTTESWGGNLEIKSEIGKGTSVIIKLPVAEPPAWFVSKLELSDGQAVVVLDDDESIHQVWQSRFASARGKEQDIEIFHFNEPDKLRGWVRDNTAKAESAVYLFDYELLGHKETGLSLAEELGLTGKAILVTSRYEEKRIIEGCGRLRIRMIPKGLAGLVPIETVDSGQWLVDSSETAKPVLSLHTPDIKTASAVLIDDDALVHMTWKMAARAKGVTLKAFKAPADFLSGLDAFLKDTPIYIDSELGDGIKGEDIAKDLREKGFACIYLETGHPPENFSHLPWLKVIGKEPPWGEDS